MQVKPIKTSLFGAHDDLFSFITRHVKRFRENDVFVVTSKIVALSQGCVIKNSEREKHIQNVSVSTIETPWATLTLTGEGWCINAGVDESNAQNGCITLPEKPFGCAHTILGKLKKMYAVRNLGLIITDTRSVPLRAGTVGRAIGCAGFQPFKSYVGKKDLYRRKSRVTVSNVADALATSAVIVMGEGSERTPLAIIGDAPVAFTQKRLSTDEMRLFLLPHEDIFTYVYKDALEKPRARSTRKR